MGSFNIGDLSLYLRSKNSDIGPVDSWRYHFLESSVEDILTGLEEVSEPKDKIKDFTGFIREQSLEYQEGFRQQLALYGDDLLSVISGAVVRNESVYRAITYNYLPSPPNRVIDFSAVDDYLDTRGVETNSFRGWYHTFEINELDTILDAFVFASGHNPEVSKFAEKVRSYSEADQTKFHNDIVEKNASVMNTINDAIRSGRDVHDYVVADFDNRDGHRYKHDPREYLPAYLNNRDAGFDHEEAKLKAVAIMSPDASLQGALEDLKGWAGANPGVEPDYKIPAWRRVADYISGTARYDGKVKELVSMALSIFTPEELAELAMRYDSDLVYKQIVDSEGRIYEETEDSQVQQALLPAEQEKRRLDSIADAFKSWYPDEYKRFNEKLFSLADAGTVLAMLDERDGEAALALAVLKEQDPNAAKAVAKAVAAGDSDSTENEIAEKAYGALYSAAYNIKQTYRRLVAYDRTDIADRIFEDKYLHKRLLIRSNLAESNAYMIKYASELNTDHPSLDNVFIYAVKNLTTDNYQKLLAAFPSKTEWREKEFWDKAGIGDLFKYMPQADAKAESGISGEFQEVVEPSVAKKETSTLPTGLAEKFSNYQRHRDLIDDGSSSLGMGKIITFNGVHELYLNAVKARNGELTGDEQQAALEAFEEAYDKLNDKLKLEVLPEPATAPKQVVQP